jgi:hypothetical protein
MKLVWYLWFSRWWECALRASGLRNNPKDGGRFLLRQTLTTTIRRCRVVNTPATYSGGSMFKSRPGERLYWLRFLVVFLILSRQFHSTLYSLSLWKKVVKRTKKTTVALCKSGESLGRLNNCQLRNQGSARCLSGTKYAALNIALPLLTLQVL